MRYIILFVCFLPVICSAAGGDTLKYTTAVKTLANGQKFYADLHWKSMIDTNRRVINGALGNINLSSTAQIDPTKLDTLKTLLMTGVRVDTVKIRNRLRADTAEIAKGHIVKLTGDTIASIRGTIDTLYSKKTKIDTAYFGAKKLYYLTGTVNCTLYCGSVRQIVAGVPYEITDNKLTLKFDDFSKSFNYTVPVTDTNDGYFLRITRIPYIENYQTINGKSRAYIKMWLSEAGGHAKEEIIEFGFSDYFNHQIGLFSYGEKVKILYDFDFRF